MAKKAAKQRRVGGVKRKPKPEPVVRRGKWPEWLHRRLRQRFGNSDEYDWRWPMTVLLNEWNVPWIDHWGTMAWPGDRVAFVAEPYLTVDAAAAVAAPFAEEFGISFVVTKDSEWNPPRTVRIAFFEDEHSTPVEMIERMPGRDWERVVR